MREKIGNGLQVIKFGFKFLVGSSVPVILISMAETKEDKRRMSD
jgi:hypothetical protein